jgi:predicted ABC-type ATPase
MILLRWKPGDALPSSTYFSTKPATKYSPDPSKLAAANGGRALALYQHFADPNVTPADIRARLSPELQAKMDDAEARLAVSTRTDALVADGGFKNPDGTYTPERQAVHEEIMNKFLNPEAVAAATPEHGEKPVYTILGGRSGAGKSFLTSEEGPVDAKHAIVLDPDAIKGMLPGYEGWNAGLYHAESSDIFNAIDKTARDNGLNIIHDATMKTGAAAMGRIKDYADAGYRVEGAYMFTPPQESAMRVVSRFAGPSGRYVPLSAALSNVKNEYNFDQAKPLMDKWSIYTNMGGKGASPKLYARSGG